MICKRCGSDISRDENYCPVCGEKVERPANTERNNTEDYFKSYGSNRKETPKIDNFKIDDRYAIPSPGPRKVFAIISFVLGIVFLCICWFPFFSLIFGIIGLVFGILGIKSNKRGYAVAGVIINIISVAVCAFITIDSVKTYKRAGNSLSKAFKDYALKKADTVYQTGKNIILEEIDASTLTLCTYNDGKYSVTADDLYSAGELESNPFRNAGTDGGMTIYYEKSTGSFSCTFSGDILGYEFEFVKGVIRIKK